MEEYQEDKTPTSEDFIRDNIDKANVLLDLALEQIQSRERVSSEMILSISRLIDSITTAATALISAETDGLGLQLKADLVELKRRELDMKSLSQQPKLPQQNIFVGSFSELLKQIKVNKSENLLE